MKSNLKKQVTYKKALIFLMFTLFGYNHLFAQLTIYQNQNQTGTQGTCVQSTIYKGTTIPQSLDNSISSINLQQGYMATMAENEDGSGNRYTFIAAVSNVTVNLSAQLNDKVSFIRVLPFINNLKKGVGNTDNTNVAALGVAWFYDWGAADVSTSSSEYSPMSWGKSAASFSKIPDYISQTGVNTLLSFNEPDNSNQSNIDYQTAVYFHENLAAVGLRTSSPACEEGGATVWLSNFMNSANARNINVDFIAVHWYDWGSYSSTNNTAPNVNNLFNRFKTYINNIYSLYNKPIWITEFNANPNTTEATHTAFMALALPWLDSQPFVERYAYFFPPALPPMSGGSLTPIGTAYKNHTSTASFTVNKDNTAVTGSGNSRYVYEAENATLNGSNIVTSCSNVSGGKMVSATTGANSVSFQNVSVASAGNYYLDISYYAKTGKSGIQVKINGGTPISLTFPSNGNWCYESGNNFPGVYEATVTLNAGNNTIEFSESTILDKINLTGIIGTLPIKLVDFSAEVKDYGVKLNWETAQETNNQYFEVLKADENKNFETIAQIKGAINSTTPKFYSYADKYPLAGANYYMLKQVDLDGKSTTSNPIVTYFSLNNNDFKVIKSTVNNVGLQIDLQDAESGMITCVSINGEILYKQKVSFKSGINTLEIPISTDTGSVIVINYHSDKMNKSIKIIR